MKPMTSRERTFRTLDFQEADRVPIDFWGSQAFVCKLQAALRVSWKDFLDAYDVDLRYIDGPAYIGPALKKYPDGSEHDLWGVRRKAVTVPTGEGAETYWEVLVSPLAEMESVEEVEAYSHWPSPDWFDYRPVQAQCEAVRQRDRVVVFMGDRLNRVAQLKPAMYLRGVEQILIDLSLKPAIAQAIFGRVRQFYLGYMRRIFEASRQQLDILLTGDDFGSQNRPLLSPAMWQQFIEPGFAEYIRLAKHYDLRVMHHTCGAVRPLIPSMMRCGLDVLQSLQPEATGMDARTLKQQFGRTLAFHGGISIQRTLPFGTHREIRAEVANRVESLARGGGYILCTSHNIQADTPVNHAVTLVKAYHELGRRNTPGS